ncbi:MAG: hypothetical protein APR54_08565 [Candidatus Cloacimonas sp. SDB]|nr:MAG: hypothetical protein APR54_08565 [Candidatus Cloacimonas sp. SDB]
MPNTNPKPSDKTLDEHRQQCKNESLNLLCYSLIGTLIPFLLGLVIQIYDYKTFSILHLFSHGEFFLYSACLFTYVFYLSQKNKYVDQKLKISLIIPLIGIIIASVSYAQIINLDKSKIYIIILVSFPLFIISSISYFNSHYKFLLNETLNLQPDLLEEIKKERNKLEKEFNLLGDKGAKK